MTVLDRNIHQVAMDVWHDQNQAVVIAGISFASVTMGQAVERIVRLAENPDGAHQICTANLDHLAMVRRNPVFRAAYHDADMVLADGMPVVWLSQLVGRQGLPERVAGSDLLWELGRASARTGIRLFYLGGAPGAAEEAAAAVTARFPGAQVCGCYCPSFEDFGTPEEEGRITTAIRAAQPQALLVGLGAPKQEIWIAANKERLGVPVCIGVGGSFEMAAGRVRRAPRWMQRTGLEWSYRLIQEPARLWRRYLLRDLPTLVSLLWATWFSRMAANRLGRS